VHFGLGDRSNIDSVRIRWPRGLIQTLPKPAINTLHKILEPHNSSALASLSVPVRRRGFLRRLRSLGRRPQLRSLALLGRGSPPRARLWAKPPTGTLSAFPLGRNAVPIIAVAPLAAFSGSIGAVLTVTSRGSQRQTRGSAPSGGSARRVPRGTERALAMHEARTPRRESAAAVSDLCGR